MPSYPIIQFSQFGLKNGRDDLLMAAVPCGELDKWAAVPVDFRTFQPLADVAF